MIALFLIASLEKKTCASSLSCIKTENGHTVHTMTLLMAETGAQQRLMIRGNIFQGITDIAIKAAVNMKTNLRKYLMNQKKYFLLKEMSRRLDFTNINRGNRTSRLS